jgi:hypothetical protein
MSNLVNGVVTRRLAAADATRAKVGACGTKLLNGLAMNTIGGPVYGFPSGSPKIQQSAPHGARLKSFSLARVRQQAVGGLLLTSWNRKTLKLGELFLSAIAPLRQRLAS